MTERADIASTLDTLALEGLRISPRVGIISGSGLSRLADKIMDIEFKSEIPIGGDKIRLHQDKFFAGSIANIPAAIFNGRTHCYEDMSPQELAFQTALFAKLGVKLLILTNAAGAINASFKPGDVMMIDDHINLLGINPLAGLRNPATGEADAADCFIDMNNAYDADLRAACARAAENIGAPIHSGIYAAMRGPSYETPAEIAMLRALGADAVGMSTVPETITARYFGIKVLGLSVMTNMAAGLNAAPITHEEVSAVMKSSIDTLAQIIRSFLLSYDAAEANQ